MDSPLCVRRMASASTGAMSIVLILGQRAFFSSWGHVFVTYEHLVICMRGWHVIHTTMDSSFDAFSLSTALPDRMAARAL